MTHLHSNPSLQTAVLDIIIEPVDDLPGAGGLRLESEIVRMSNEHHKFSGVLIQIINLIETNLTTEPDTKDGKDRLISSISTVESNYPDIFELFIELIYLAYYSDPRVHRRIGWKTGPIQPNGHLLPPWDESILNKVKNKEPFWIHIE